MLHLDVLLWQKGKKRTINQGSGRTMPMQQAGVIKETENQQTPAARPNVRVRLESVKRKVVDLPCVTAEIGISITFHKIA
jgi:hypothetical protein